MPKQPKPVPSASVLAAISAIRDRGMAATALNVSQAVSTPVPKAVMARWLKTMANDGQLVRRGKTFELPTE